MILKFLLKFYRRTGIEILAGKTVKKNADGFEDFRDYLSESGKKKIRHKLYRYNCTPEHLIYVVVTHLVSTSKVDKDFKGCL